MPPLISIQNLTVAFNNDGATTVAVKNSNIEIKKGELVAIVGESGSGKSVTAMSLLKLLPDKTTQSKGKIFFYQKETPPVDLLTATASEIQDIRGKKISMIFQEPMTSLNPVFKCGSQVLEAIRLHEKISYRKAKEKTIALFDKVKLPEPEKIFSRYPHEISGGQKQRVMIAMAICCNPLLLIADEPATALDVTVQKTILELIKDLQEQNNMGVMLITHDLGVVADIADKIVVMYKGAIVEQGNAKQILQAPQHPYTKALLACRPAGKPKGEKLPVVSDFIKPDNNTDNDTFIVNTASDKKPAELNTESANTPVLTIQNLSVYFPVKKKLFGKPAVFFKAVDDVSFEVMQGETLGLVGESGCGKTTLGRTILKLVTPTAGKIILHGKDITLHKADELRRMRKDLQIVFQDPYGSLNPRITVGSAVLEALQVHDILQNSSQRKDKVVEMLEKVDLKSEHFNRYPHQFSGGQRQRICIARALALNPSFLIFDESVSALDVSVQAQVLNLLNDLKKEFNFTSIFISHDLSVVHYISDRIMVMHKGKIVEAGTASQIWLHPQQEYTQQLINAIPGRQLIFS